VDARRSGRLKGRARLQLGRSNAAIGALAAGGTGALLGGPVGAGAGTTVALLTGKKDIKLHAETPLTFKLAEPVTIPVKS
jgi:hypothetical protein